MSRNFFQECETFKWNDIDWKNYFFAEVSALAYHDGTRAKRELNKELSSKLADAEKENTIIRDKLAKSNLIADSIANPKVMEQKINEQIDTIFGALSNSTK